MSKSYAGQVTTLLLGLGLAVSFLIALGIPFPNEDLFLAFCAGRDTVHGLLGEPNQWSYTIPANVWVDQSWLAHLLLYLSYVEIGDTGPLLVKGVLVASTLLLVFLRCRAMGASTNASLVALTLGGMALAPFANIRAHLFGMLMFAVLAHLLTMPPNRNRLAQIGSASVIAVWGNVHGSFMLGLFLLVLRAFVEIIAAARHMRFSGRTAVLRGSEPAAAPLSMSQAAEGPAFVSECPADAVGWVAAMAAGLLLAAFANPYGPENLMMPFRQFFGSERTIPWVDWLPLLHAGSMKEKGILWVHSVIPFLLFVAWLGTLLTTCVLVLGPRAAQLRIAERMATPNKALEILLPLIMIPLAFKFQRMVVFAVPALIPAVAVLMTALPDEVTGRFASLRRLMAASARYRTSVLLALLWVICGAFLLYRYVAVPLLPDNPLSRLRPDTGLSSRLLHHNFVAQDVAEFMRQNRLNGRIFSNLYLADYLLLEVPGVEVFIDLRAHSAYPSHTIETYAGILDSGAADLAETLAILDRYRVSYVVLDTCDTECRGLLHGLMTSKQWGCIYREKNGCVFVLTRADSAAFRGLLDGVHVDGLQYKASEERVVAESIGWLFARGTLPSTLLNSLESVVRCCPDPDIYHLIAAGAAPPVPCLDEKVSNFFKSQFRRLAAETYLIAGGERSIVMSLAKVAEILEADKCHCSAEGACEAYATARTRVLHVAESLRRRYRPF